MCLWNKHSSPSLSLINLSNLLIGTSSPNAKDCWLKSDDLVFFSVLVLVFHLKSMYYLIIYVVAGHSVEKIQFTYRLWYSTNMQIYVCLPNVLNQICTRQCYRTFFSYKYWLKSGLTFNIECLEYFTLEVYLCLVLQCLKKHKCKLELLRKQECLYWQTRPFLIKFLFCVFLFFNWLIWLKGCFTSWHCLSFTCTHHCCIVTITKINWSILW